MRVNHGCCKCMDSAEYSQDDVCTLTETSGECDGSASSSHRANTVDRPYLQVRNSWILFKIGPNPETGGHQGPPGHIQKGLRIATGRTLKPSPYQ